MDTLKDTPSKKAFWKCTADQENVNTNKNPYQHQTNANWKINQQQQENHGIFGKPVQRMDQSGK